MFTNKYFAIQRGTGLQSSNYGAPRLFKSRKEAETHGTVIPVEVTIKPITIAAKKKSVKLNIID